MTKTIRWIAFLFLAMSCQVALAQQRPVRKALDEWITNAETHVVDAADAMPDEKYPFAPTSGEFAGVRTFGEQVKHLAANNYRMAAMIEGKQPTAEQEDETGPDSVKTKAQIMDYARGSFAALHKAVSTLHDADAAAVAKGQHGHDRLWLAIDAVAHSFNHYGQMVEYLRMNGIIPPDSRQK
jgi:uncharacterized damage-inducible protein DinB